MKLRLKKQRRSDAEKTADLMISFLVDSGRYTVEDVKNPGKVQEIRNVIKSRQFHKDFGEWLKSKTES